MKQVYHILLFLIVFKRIRSIKCNNIILFFLLISIFLPSHLMVYNYFTHFSQFLPHFVIIFIKLIIFCVLCSFFSFPFKCIYSELELE